MDREIVKDGSGNYLKISGDTRETYSDRVFFYQEIQGFLPLEIRWINGKKEYFYDISGKLSLKEYLNQNDFTLHDIQLLFEQIFTMAECLEEYLLDSRGLMVQEELLYIDPVTGECQGIYQEEEKQEAADSVGHLLEFIMEKMNQKDRNLVFFVYEMHKLTRGAGCTRGMLRNYASSYGERVWEKKEDRSLPVPKKTEYLPKDRKRTDRYITIRCCLLPGMVLAAGIALPIILWWMGMFRLPLSGNTDWVRAAGAAAFFLAASGYGVWRVMPGKDGKNSDRMIYHSEDRQMKRVCLIPQAGSGVPVPIPQFPYRLEIGKGDKPDPDYMRIIQEAGNVLVVDEESDQGIFHNNRRLVPWKEMPLRDGDILRFNDNEFVVEITQPEYVI